MLKASEVVEIVPGLWSFCYWRPYMIWWLPAHIFLSLIYLVYLYLSKKKKNLFGVSFVYFPCTLHIGCASFLHIYIGQPQECMKDCISIISNGTQGCMKDCLICDDQIEIYIVIEFWLLTLHVPLTNVLIFLLCFHFSAYRKLARSYHPDVNKWVLFPLLFSLSFGNVCSHCSGWVSVISELLIGFVRYELFVLGHFSFENLLHMFVIRF